MQKAHYDIVLFVLVSTLLILLMAGFIVTILYLYRKKQLAYFKTIEELKLDHEKNLLRTQLEMQEQTLQHIAREIHDNISLSLTLAKLNLNTLDWADDVKSRTQIDSSLEQIGKRYFEGYESRSNYEPGLDRGIKKGSYQDSTTEFIRTRLQRNGKSRFYGVPKRIDHFQNHPGRL